MFDIGWQELLVIGIVALIVVGPKDLPRALRTGAQLLRKARGLSREFQHGLSEVIREADLEDIKQQVDKAKGFDVGDKFREAVDPTGTLTADFDPAEFSRRLKDTVEGGPPEKPMAPQPPSVEDGAAKPAAPPGGEGEPPAPAKPRKTRSRKAAATTDGSPAPTPKRRSKKDATAGTGSPTGGKTPPSSRGA